MTMEFNSNRNHCKRSNNPATVAKKFPYYTKNKPNFTSQSDSFRSNRFSLRRTCIMLSGWPLIALLIFLPSTQAVTLYFGANDNSMSNADFKHIANQPVNELNMDDMRSVYTFCNLMPFLIETGRMRNNQEAKKVCNKLMGILDPLFGDEKVSLIKRRISRSLRSVIRNGRHR
ncbi:hypothetical protein M3Y94_00271300 [Aphelenchoides besseyi]|nr:hypothetical protein M3Y94_00271300 [Aphelenchoides besseyi]KAI6236079.1 hypothetical protein M3Y95_00119500 [Aphelenchoides besseyi]